MLNQKGLGIRIFFYLKNLLFLYKSQNIVSFHNVISRMNPEFFLQKIANNKKIENGNLADLARWPFLFPRHTWQFPAPSAGDQGSIVKHTKVELMSALFLSHNNPSSSSLLSGIYLSIFVCSLLPQLICRECDSSTLNSPTVLIIMVESCPPPFFCSFRRILNITKQADNTFWGRKNFRNP